MLNRINQRGGQPETGTPVRLSDKHRVTVYSAEAPACLSAPSQRDEWGMKSSLHTLDQTRYLAWGSIHPEEASFLIHI